MAKAYTWTDYEIDILKKYYPYGGYKECQKYINKTQSQIKDKARYMGIKSLWKDTSIETRRLIREKYKFLPITDIAKELNLDVLLVRSVISQYESLDKRAKVVGDNFLLKSGLNKDFFKHWTPEMAWVLGVITSDGCVMGDRLQLNMVDSDVVEKVRDLLAPKADVRYTAGVNRNQTLFTISNKVLISDLNNLGVHDRKSLNIEPPKLPNDMVNHYIRGLIDGDGGVRINERNKLIIDFIGSYGCVKLVNNYLNKVTESSFAISKQSTKSGKIIFSTRVTSLKAIKFGCFIYRGSNDKIRMNRKFMIFEDEFKRNKSLITGGV